MSLRFVVLLVLVPVLVALSLKKPLWGVFSLLFMYYFRPDVWGQPTWWRPVEWLTIATVLSWAIRVKDVRVERLLGLSMVFLATMALSSFTAVGNAEKSWDATETIAKLMLMQFVAVQVIRNLREIHQFLWVHVLANVWTLKSALVQTLGGGGEVRVNVGAGQGGGANYLAMTFVMALPLLYFRYLNGSRLERKLAIMLAPLFVIAVVGTGSRGGYLTLFSILVFLSVRSNRKLAGFATVVLFSIVFAVFTPQEKWDRFVNTFTGEGKETAADNSRVGLWKVGLQLFAQYPITGVGHDNFQVLSPRLYGFFAGRTPIPYDPILEGNPKYSGFVAHSIWVQSLADGGLLGSIPLFLLFAVSLRMLYVIRRMQLPPPEQRDFQVYSQIFEGTMWAFMIASTFASHVKLDFLWYYFGGIGAFWLIARERARLWRHQRLALLQAESAEPAERTVGA